MDFFKLLIVNLNVYMNKARIMCDFDDVLVLVVYSCTSSCVKIICINRASSRKLRWN
jgi:hypothetical protein